MGQILNAITDFNITHIYHFTPIHYLGFILRSNALMSKNCLRAVGFNDNHFRSTSKKQDMERGFKKYAHLTTCSFPPILKAKLSAGFPHVAIRIPSTELDNVDFELCRYNVAKTRKLRRGNQFGHDIGPANGQYYDDIQIPIARSDREKNELLKGNYPQGRMLEVLVNGQLDIGDSAEVIAFCSQDFVTVEKLQDDIGIELSCSLRDDITYDSNPEYTSSCQDFLNQSVKEPDWRGNGLEFDKV